jgi:aryl-alcohol dehydrogenase-like predicted oxidoreductase
VQNRYNLTDRGSDAVLDLCERKGLGFIPWFPLANGNLAQPGGAAQRFATVLARRVPRRLLSSARSSARAMSARGLTRRIPRHVLSSAKRSAQALTTTGAQDQVQSKVLLERIAARHNATTGQVALAWLLMRSPVMIPIPGTTSAEHLEANVASAELRLTREEFQELAAVVP